MGKIMRAMAAVAVGAIVGTGAGAASAATQIIDFAVSGNWTFTGGDPFNVGANPTLTGSLTVDVPDLLGSEWLGPSSVESLSLTTGDKAWTTADLNAALPTFHVGEYGGVEQVDDILIALGVSGDNVTISSGFAALNDGDANGNCLGCLTFTPTPTGDFVNISAPVPEPAEWMLGIGGLFAVGAILRRRSVGAVVA